MESNVNISKVFRFIPLKTQLLTLKTTPTINSTFDRNTNSSTKSSALEMTQKSSRPTGSATRFVTMPKPCSSATPTNNLKMIYL